jgi:4-hydroxy 2-oxovalerate aldolase
MIMGQKDIKNVYKETLFSDFVRIATRPEHLDNSLEACSMLKDKDQMVCLNLAYAFDNSYTEQCKIFEKIADKQNDIDVLYFADSMGNINANQLTSMHVHVRQYLPDIKLGLHAHNNTGQALTNSLYANDLGWDFIDGTITGFGRGAGNCPTEQLTNDPSIEKLAVSLMYSQKAYKYGYNPLYGYAAKRYIHPSYVQELLTTDLNYAMMFLILEKIDKIPGKGVYTSDSLRFFLKEDK